MPLTDVLERLYARRRFGIRPGVDRVSTLLDRLGNPEQQFRTIHVVGTNGKGSTSAFLSSILLHAGHAVAQFSSPHLVRFTERFRINGSEYSAEKLASRMDAVLEAAPDEATFFEITTALAALIFSEERSRAGNCTLKTLGADFSIAWNADRTLDYRGMNRTLTRLAPGLPGRYQSGNAAVALAAAEALETEGTSIGAPALANGISAARWPGRMELVPGTPPLLLDGAHNPAGASALAEALRDYSYRRLLLVTGVCSDKDIDRIYAPLTPLVDAIYTVTPAVERALRDEELSRFFSTQGIASEPCGSVASAIGAARSHAAEGDLVLVCGSLFVVGEARAWLEQVQYTGIRG